MKMLKKNWIFEDILNECLVEDVSVENAVNAAYEKYVLYGIGANSGAYDETKLTKILVALSSEERNLIALSDSKAQNIVRGLIERHQIEYRSFCLGSKCAREQRLFLSSPASEYVHKGLAAFVDTQQ